MEKKNHTIRRIALALTLLLALPAFAAAATPAEDGPRPSEVTIDNELIQKRVQRILDSRLRTAVFDWVEAEIDGSTVTLHGAVNLGATANRIARRIEKIDGIERVENKVDLLPVNGFDDDLRRQAFRLIYGDITFAQYPLLARAPIHIIVDRGEVTLLGTVSSRAEAKLAEFRVRADTLAFKVHNELRTSRELREEMGAKTGPTA